MVRTHSTGAALAVLATLAFAACTANPALPSTGTPPATVAEAATTALRNLPEIKPTLPRSLSVNTDASRALGDTTVLDVNSLPGLKSQAWYNLQNGNNGVMVYVNGAFDLIRDYAATRTIEPATVYEVPVTNALLKSIFGMDNILDYVGVNFRFKAAGADAANISVYLTVKVTAASNPQQVIADATARIDVATADSGTQTFKVYIQVAQAIESTTYTTSCFAMYDTATQEMVGVADGTMGSQSMQSVMRSSVGADGSMSTINVMKMDNTPQYVYAAYGNDTAGGIASLGSSSYDSNGDGTPESHDFYWGEYYNGQGELLKRSNGDTSLFVPVWTGNAVINLKDLGFTSAPAEAATRSFWDNGISVNGNTGASVSQVRKADGTWHTYSRGYWDQGSNTWINQTSTDGTTWTDGYAYPSIVYKSGAAWAGGDAVYYWKSGASSEESGTWYWTNTLYQGYVVPTPASKFGKNFYVTNEYPLRSIMPLSQAYATDYQIIQEEGATSTWDWTDYEGKSRTTSWTNYKFYLNKTQASESPVRFNSADGDIDLNDKISRYEMYYWTGSAIDKVMGWFLRTSGAVPPYFTQPNEGLVNQVDTSLQTVLDTAYNISVDSYATELAIARNGPAAGQF